MKKVCKIRKGKNWVQIGREPLEHFFTYSNEKRYRIISEERDGYFVTIPNEMGTSEKWVEHLHEAFSLIGKYDNEALEIEKRAKRLSDYLTSDEGNWGVGS